METLIVIVLILVLVLGWLIMRRPPCPLELIRLPEIPRWGLLKSLIIGEPFNLNYDRRIEPYLDPITGTARMFVQGKWTIILSRDHHLQTIYHNPTSFRKSDPENQTSPRLLFQFLGLKNIFLNDLEEWKKIRVTVNPAFKQSWEPELFGKITMEFIERVELDIEQKKFSDIHPLFQRLTIDALSRGLLNYDFQAQRGGNDPYLKLYTDIMKGIFDPLCLIVPSLETILPSRNKLRSKNHQFRYFLSLLLEKRKLELKLKLKLKLNSHQSNDILTLMINQNLPTLEIINNLATFFSTGHDTTANALTTIITLLALHPTIQDKVRSEILHILGDDDQLIPPTHQQQRQMVYLVQVLKESLRMVPTIGVLRRYCQETTPITDLTLPEGCNLVLHLWSLHHNPSYFPNPNRFDPDRFLDPHGPQARHFTAFGGGSRLCIGIGFSYSEQRVVLSLLLKKFKFHLPPSSPPPNLCPYGLLHYDNVRINFKPRF